MGRYEPPVERFALRLAAGRHLQVQVATAAEHFQNLHRQRDQSENNNSNNNKDDDDDGAVSGYRKRPVGKGIRFKGARVSGYFRKQQDRVLR